MADQRDGGIAWTEETWNPTRGCSRVSSGCKHCYAEIVAARFSGPGQPYEGLVRLSPEGKGLPQWNGVMRPVPDHLEDPLRWTRPRRVFVNSMSDLFHEALTFPQIAAIFGVMAASSRHTFQILTKRPERAADFFAWAESRGEDGRSMFPNDDAGWRIRQCMHVEARRAGADLNAKDRQNHGGPWPLPNVWIGTSVENQETADERIPHLKRVPAVVRFVSYEPAIGPVDFYPLLEAGIDWVIIGGESGKDARPFDMWWANTTVDACRAFGVACFVKQMGSQTVTPVEDPEASNYGERLPIKFSHYKGGHMEEWPLHLRIREFPMVMQ